MPLYVVTFPALSDGDCALVEDVRARFDPQHRTISPHVTLVFGIEGLGVDALISHVVTLTRGVAPFTCVFRRTLVAPDVATAGSCVFLVPDEGSEELTRLHDALYSGALAADLRPEIAFVPHITVARCGSAEEARSVAASLDARSFALRGRVDALEILIAVEGQAVRTARAIALA